MNAETRKHWRDRILSDVAWRRDTRFPNPTGGCQGFLVKAVDSEVRAYLKPTIRDQNRSIAAYEKIASDLAFEVGVNVPPAMLYVRDDDPTANEKNVVVSLVPTGTSEHLPANNPNNRFTPSLRAASGAVAFDAWLGNADRGHLGNSLIAHDETPDIFFLDFANAMDWSGAWNQGGAGVMQRPNLPPIFSACLERGLVKDSSKRISDLSNDVVQNIVVDRIPDAFMPLATREKISGWLIQRKALVSATFEQWYG